MSIKKAASTDNQVMLNKALLYETERENTVNSWLHANVTHDNFNGNQTGLQETRERNEKYDEYEEEDFSAESETGGLDSIRLGENQSEVSSDRQTFAANDKLRRHFLGKNTQMNSRGQKGQVASKPRPQQRHQIRKGQSGGIEDDDDDDEARTKVTSSIAKGQGRRIMEKGCQSKNNSVQGTNAMSSPTAMKGNDNNNGDSTHIINTLKTGKKRKSTSYLDEMLAKRGKKKASVMER